LYESNLANLKNLKFSKNMIARIIKFKKCYVCNSKVIIIESYNE